MRSTAFCATQSNKLHKQQSLFRLSVTVLELQASRLLQKGFEPCLSRLLRENFALKDSVLEAADELID